MGAAAWAGDYSKQVLADKPALYFRFDQVEGSVIKRRWAVLKVH